MLTSMRFQTAIVLMGALVLQTACGSKDSNNQNPAPPATPPVTAPQPEDAKAAATAFSQTLVNGTKKWTFKKTLMTVKRTNIATGAVKDQFTVNCLTSTPLLITGAYPTVSLQMAKITCSPSKANAVLTQLQLVSANLKYTATHTPVEADANLFHLELQPAEAAAMPKWKTHASVKSAASAKTELFDFAGSAPINATTDTQYTMQIGIAQNVAGTAEKMVLNMTILAADKTEIELKPDLIRVK